MTATRAPLRIIAVGHYPPFSGGSGLSCAQIFQGIADRGHRVHVLASITPDAPTYDDDARSRLPKSMTVSRYPVPYFNVTQYDVLRFPEFQAIEHDGIRRTLPALIDDVRPNVIVSAHETLGDAVLDVAHARGLPCAVLLRGSPTWQVVTGAYPPDMTAAYLACLRRADVVIAVGQYMQTRLSALGLAHTRYVPNQLDLNLFKPAPRRQDLLDAFGVPRESTVVLHASLMQSRKRPEDVIQSAAIALPQASRLVYLFVGGGARAETLAAGTRQGPNADRIRFVPAVPYADMPAIVNLADVVVLASAGEGISRVYLETQACARVLISSDIPAGREVVEHGVTGLLFRTGDAADLAAQILTAYHDPALRTRIGQAARHRVQKHGIETVIGQYIDAFQDFVRDGASAAM